MRSRRARRPARWETLAPKSPEELWQCLFDLQGRRWLCRGQSISRGTLVPSIDRDRLAKIGRIPKLDLERRSINQFRAAAKFFASQGEEQTMTDDIIALAVLRHYGSPTRLLDWTHSPYVAAYFAATGHPEADGEIWAFDEPHYERRGLRQWSAMPENTIDGKGKNFSPHLKAFSPEYTKNWFICVFYGSGFPRQNAQSGAYSMTCQFGVDHADAIATVLGNASRHRRYIVAPRLKTSLLPHLRERHGIWRGSLFPDTEGATQTAADVFRSL